MVATELAARTGRHDAPAAATEDPRVVIVGAGFGGLSAAKALGRSAARVTIIDRRNYHLFQPLLYQVATAGLSPADIAAPIRGIVRDQANTGVLLGRVSAVDTAARQVIVENKRIPYDFLILATGARHAYSDADWERFAPGLKKIEDATAIRAKILMSFERAEASDDGDEQRRLLTFLVVGGGPTGVELAGAIAELAKRVMARDFRRIDPRGARIVLLQSTPRVLERYPKRLSEIARASLERLGVEVRTDARVEHVDATGAVVSGRRIEAGTVIWAAGVMASPAGRWLGAERDAEGRVKVGADLSVAGLPSVFVIGDTVNVRGKAGRRLPGIAPVAKQQGRYVAKLIRARLAGRRFDQPFRYRHFGDLATIGRSSAVADLGFLRLSGYPAWVL